MISLSFPSAAVSVPAVAQLTWPVLGMGMVDMGMVAMGTVAMGMVAMGTALKGRQGHLIPHSDGRQ